MKDAKGTEIKVGHKIKRIIDDGTNFVGRVYTVITHDFTDENSQELCAESYEQILLLYPERAKQFEVVGSIGK